MKNVRIMTNFVPSGCTWLTAGKWYDAVQDSGFLDFLGRSFYFKNDDGIINFTNELNSIHIGGHDWVVDETSDG